MTLNDLEYPIHLKVRLMNGTLDVRLLRVSDSTIGIDVARGGGKEGGLQGLDPPCGQLTRCFSAVAELLVYSTFTNVLCSCGVFTFLMFSLLFSVFNDAVAGRGYFVEGYNIRRHGD